MDFQIGIDMAAHVPLDIDQLLSYMRTEIVSRARSTDCVREVCPVSEVHDVPRFMTFWTRAVSKQVGSTASV